MLASKFSARSIDKLGKDGHSFGTTKRLSVELVPYHLYIINEETDVISKKISFFVSSQF